MTREEREAALLETVRALGDPHPVLHRGDVLIYASEDPNWDGVELLVTGAYAEPGVWRIEFKGPETGRRERMSWRIQWDDIKGLRRKPR